MLASLDQSLKRLGLDYVDIFYSHRFDPDTPLEETMGALATAVQAGKALYVGISSYSAHKTAEAAALLRSARRAAPHPPAGLQHVQPLDRGRRGCSTRWGRRAWAASPSRRSRKGCSPTSTSTGIPKDARINRPGGGSIQKEHLSEENLARVKALNEIAGGRGQSLAQMALAWTVRDPRVTSTLIGASHAARSRRTWAP